jgi:hypothetical protein
MLFDPVLIQTAQQVRMLCIAPLVTKWTRDGRWQLMFLFVAVVLVLDLDLYILVQRRKFEGCCQVP